MTKKVPTRKTIRHNPNAPGPVQAAQIALVLMTTAKTDNWNGVVADETLFERVELTDEQQALLEEHRGILPYLTRGGYDGTLRSIVACPACGRVMFMAQGTAPKKCSMKLACEGIPVKAKSTQEPLPKDPDAEKAKELAAAAS
ncbi:hypothetical protein [Microbacterium sp. 77mftsu3.1]|uniref:hypothetical protein n=1 Tax=Microbacterium sp. 77mftsu3.1 TaxID=1761802 RepID=UPI0003775B36|nr:hypothetical protein [Microbacterium sp. 77mftsu3.1]SDH32163.1 hypothetical protein SAMN04488590_3021 [Microbacterium sp. 77mftsu3.1]